MEEKKKKIVNTNLGILLICLFCSVFTLADFLVVDHILGKYFDYSKCNCPKCVDSNLNLDGVIDNKKEESESVSFCESVTTNVCNNILFELIGAGKNYILDDNFNVRTVSDKISLVRFSKYADVEVVDGSLVFKIHKYTIDGDSESAVLDDSYNENFTYNIPGESIKYIYTYYYQPSGEEAIYVLTDNNNLYMSKYKHLIKESEFNFDAVTDFKLIKSDVSELRVVFCAGCLRGELHINGQSVNVQSD